MEPSTNARAPAQAKPDMMEFAQMWSDPQRRRLFEEFLKTMSDPEERKKFESDFKELRKSLKKDKSPKEKILIDAPAPAAKEKTRIAFEPSFCLETSAVYLKDYHEETRPVFVNICASDEVGDYRAHLWRPCRHPHHGTEHHHEHECTLDHKEDHSHHQHEHSHAHSQPAPFSHSSVEITGVDETDKSRDYMEIPYVSHLEYKSNEFRIYNFAFGTGSIRRAITQRDSSFRALLIRTALQSLREKYDENLVSDQESDCKSLPQGSYKQPPMATTESAGKDFTYPPVILKQQNSLPPHCVPLEPQIFANRDDWLEATLTLGQVDEQIFSFATEYAKSQLSTSSSSQSFIAMRASPTMAGSVAVPACSIRQTNTHIIVIIEWTPPHGLDLFDPKNSSCKLLLGPSSLCVRVAADQRKGIELVLCLEFFEPIENAASATLRCTVSERNIALALPKQNRHFWKQLLSFKQTGS